MGVKYAPAHAPRRPRRAGPRMIVVFQEGKCEKAAGQGESNTWDF